MRFVEVDNGTLLNTDHIESISYVPMSYEVSEKTWCVGINTIGGNYLYQFAVWEDCADNTEKARKIAAALAKWLNLPESESCRHTIARYDGADGVEEVK